MSPLTYLLDYGGLLARLRRRRRRRRRSYAPTSNTTSHDNHEKINSWVSFAFLYGCGAPLGGPSGHRSSAITCAHTHTEVLNRTDETHPGGRSCPRLQFLAFCFDYHFVVTLSSLCSNQSCLIVIRFLFWGDQIYHRSYVY